MYVCMYITHFQLTSEHFFYMNERAESRLMETDIGLLDKHFRERCFQDSRLYCIVFHVKTLCGLSDHLSEYYSIINRVKI